MNERQGDRFVSINVVTDGDNPAVSRTILDSVRPVSTSR